MVCISSERIMATPNPAGRKRFSSNLARRLPLDGAATGPRTSSSARTEVAVVQPGWTRVALVKLGRRPWADAQVVSADRATRSAGLPG
jgi:hypothetical protein